MSMDVYIYVMFNQYSRSKLKWVNICTSAEQKFETVSV